MAKTAVLLLVLFLSGCSKAQSEKRANPIFGGSGSTSSSAPVPLTLKQLICQLDAKVCKRHLQYMINQQFDEHTYWAAFMWPVGMSYWQASNPIEDGGVPRWIADDDGGPQYPTKEAAIKALIAMLDSNAPPNLVPEHRDNTPVNAPPLEPGIRGPKNCDQHKTCE